MFDCVTVEVGCEAEDIIFVLHLVSVSIASDTRHCVLPSTWLPWLGNGILYRPIIQPACVTPIQSSSPRFVKLIKRGNDRVLILACLLSLIKVQIVTTQPWEVWVYNT